MLAVKSIPAIQIRDMIVVNHTKMELSDRTIRRVLPDELKDKKMHK